MVFIQIMLGLEKSRFELNFHSYRRVKTTLDFSLFELCVFLNEPIRIMRMPLYFSWIKDSGKSVGAADI